jgi:hypothetical protein
MRTSCLLAVAMMASIAAFAASSRDPALVTPRPEPNEPFRFFGDRTVIVPLLIYAPEPDGLAIRAELVQLTSSLTATVARELEVPFSAGRTVGPGNEAALSVPLPAVKRETDFELRFRSRRQEDGVWQPAGRVAIRVYPADLLSPLRAWAESHALRVEDDHGSLSEFLRREEIRVAARPGPRGIALYSGTRAIEKRENIPTRDDESAVVFTERETEVPRLLIDRTGRAATIKVEMRIVDRLATDPLAQKFFLEVFQLLHEQEPSTKGVIR